MGFIDMNDNDSVTVTVKGHPVILDRDFAEDFDPDKWGIMRMKGGRYIYVAVHAGYENGKKIVALLHRVVAVAGKGQCVDHINRNTMDNRRCNLRICTRGENSRNRGVRHDSKSGAKGVYYRPPNPKKRMKNGVWSADIHANGRRHHLGHFSTKEEAVTAYNEASKHYHGEFSNLNPISL